MIYLTWTNDQFLGNDDFDSYDRVECSMHDRLINQHFNEILYFSTLGKTFLIRYNETGLIP